MNKKAIVGISAGIAIVISVLAVGIPNFEPIIEPKQNPEIGLVINSPNTAVSVNELNQIYSDATSTGIGRSNVYLFWNIIEPEKDHYNWQQSDVLMSLNKQNNLKVTLFFSIINGETLGPFPDWIGKPPIQSIQEDRLVSVLDAILTRYDIIDTVIIAGQTESQFRYNEQNILPYKELFNNVYDNLKDKHPDIKIGNSFALHHVINKNLEPIVQELSLGDFVAFSYMPVDSLNDVVKTPNEAIQDLQNAFSLVPDKQTGFFEVSWSTSDFVGGSNESQSEFLKNSFEFYLDNDSQIEFFTWYRLHDRPVGTCVSQTANIGEGKISIGGGSGLGTNEYVIERLDNYLCNSGLKDIEGNPKTSWNEFKNQVESTN